MNTETITSTREQTDLQQAAGKIIEAYARRVPVYTAKAGEQGEAILPEDVTDDWDY